jgi:hypothetical protein
LLDGLADAHIGAAAAKIPAHAFSHFRFVQLFGSVDGNRAGSAFTEFRQHANGGTDLAGRAVAALKSITVNEGLLHGMEFAGICQAFNGYDFPALKLDCERETGVDPFTVNQNSARSARPLVATFLGTGEM